MAAPTAGPPLTARFSYGLNDSPARTAAYSVNGVYLVPLTMVTSPASAALVIESSHPMGNYSRYFDENELIPHSGGMNVLYYDGHCEWLSFTKVPRTADDVFWIGR